MAAAGVTGRSRQGDAPKVAPAPASGRFYGWYVAGALFFAMFLSIGLRQGFGIFVEPWQREFGVGVATISLAASIGWFVNGSSQVLMGWLIDRVGGRIVVTSAALLLGVSVLLMATVNSVFMLIVVYGLLMSLAAAGLAGGPPGAVIVRWFRRKRGAAMSLLTSGGSIGGLVLVPFLTYLFLWTDWRSAWLVSGAVVLLLGVPLLYLVLRDDPAKMGLLPDGEVSGIESARAAAAAGPLLARRWPDAFRSAPMWQLSAAYWVCGVTTASISVHYVRWAVAEGITPATAALAFGLLSGLNAIAVLLVGPLSDRVPRKTLLGAVYLVRSVAFVLLVILPGPAALWGFAIAGGASWLATVPLTTSLAADVYGVRHLGTLAGLINFAHQLGGALAVYLFGLVFDVHGSYDGAFLFGAAALVGAGVVSLSIRERRYSSRYAAVPQPA